jgi:hypothetical protein
VVKARAEPAAPADCLPRPARLDLGAISQAELAGTLVTMSAGNNGLASTCNLDPLGSAPSGLAVGNVFTDVVSDYSIADLAPGSSNGPVGAYAFKCAISQALTIPPGPGYGRLRDSL